MNQHSATIWVHYCEGPLFRVHYSEDLNPKPNPNPRNHNPTNPTKPYSKT